MWKRPESVLILIHRADFKTLILERADFKNGWQSVTGSLEANERPAQTAERELFEETGLRLHQGELLNWHQTQRYEIYPRWRWRYPPQVTHNVEHVFSFFLREDAPIILAPAEHVAFEWCDLATAGARVFSDSNRQALNTLAQSLQAATPA